MEATINTLWTERSTLEEELRQMKAERCSNLASPPTPLTPRDPQDDGHTPFQQDDGNPLLDDGQEDGWAHSTSYSGSHCSHLQVHPELNKDHKFQECS